MHLELLDDLASLLHGRFAIHLVIGAFTFDQSIFHGNFFRNALIFSIVDPPMSQAVRADACCDDILSASRECLPGTDDGFRHCVLCDASADGAKSVRGWLLLATAARGWLLLASAATGWFLLATAATEWFLLATAARGTCLLVAAARGWPLLATAARGWLIASRDTRKQVTFRPTPGFRDGGIPTNATLHHPCGRDLLFFQSC